jgi:Uma2 family endonuclease
MASLAGKPTLAEFEEQFGGEKPYYEFWDGTAVQKPRPGWKHGILQLILGQRLRQLSLSAGSEVRAKITSSLQFVPDVIAVERQAGRTFALTPPLLVIEILSTGDPAQMLWRKCEAYASRGVPAIYVVDPKDRKVRLLDRGLDTFTSVTEIRVEGHGAIFAEWLWKELDKEFEA